LAAAPLAAVAVPLGVYLFTLTPTVLDGDSADFARQSYRLGLAHAPGYPLMALLGKLVTTCLPFGEVGWRANLVGALSAAACLALGYALLRRWAVSRLPAVTAVWVLAFSPLFWSQALFTNPYTPQAALALAIVLLLEVWAGRRGGMARGAGTPRLQDQPLGARAAGEDCPSPGLLLLTGTAALFGFSLGGHPSFGLYLPAFAAFVLWVMRRDGLRRIAAAAGAAAAALLGCLPWLGYTLHYLSRPSDVPVQGDLLHRLAAFLTASGSPSDPSLFFRGILAKGYPAELARHVAATVGQVSPAGVLLAVLGVWALARRRGRSLLLVGAAYLIQTNFACTLPHWHTHDVYRLAPLVLLALPIGVGLAWLCERLNSLAARTAVCALLLAACVALPLVLSLLRPSEEPLLRLRPQPLFLAQHATRNRADCEAALTAAQPDGALVATWGATATLRFFQDVEGRAPGVWIIGDGPEGQALKWYLGHPAHQRPRLYVLLRDSDTALRQRLDAWCETEVTLPGKLHELRRVVRVRPTATCAAGAFLVSSGREEPRVERPPHDAFPTKPGTRQKASSR